MNLLIKNSTKNEERLRVFIIDDNKIIRDKIKEYLFLNTRVLIQGEAGTVQEGIEKLTHLNPDVVFLDIKLGEESGMSILLYLKKNKPMIKIVVFSNASDEFYKRKFRENGCDYFLDKSKDYTRIQEVLHEIRNPVSG
jgi:two-component system response regulator LytT